MSETLASQSCTRERVRGFVDVIGTLDQWPASGCEAAPDMAYLSARRRLPLPEGPVSVEVVELAAGDAGGAVLPGDEFVLVLRGDVRFEQAGTELFLKSGEAGVVLRDQPLTWRSEQGGELIVMRYKGGGAGAEAPVRIDTDAPLSPSNPPLAELLVGPTPECRNHADYRSRNGEFVCGTWASTPYHRRLMTFGHYELMRLLEGSVTFVDAAGREGRFSAGDVVLLEMGGGCSWESRVYVKKIYSYFRPAA